MNGLNGVYYNKKAATTTVFWVRNENESSKRMLWVKNSFDQWVNAQKNGYQINRSKNMYELKLLSNQLSSKRERERARFGTKEIKFAKKLITNTDNEHVMSMMRYI